jgi:hypothetical protein
MKLLDHVSLGEYGPKGWLWYPWILLMCVLTRYNGPRPDHLFESSYWRNHPIFYSSQWILWFAMLIAPVVIIACANVFLDTTSVIAIMGVAWFFSYVISWGTLYNRKQFMALFKSKASGLQTFVGILWFGWWLQGVAYVANSFLPFNPRFLSLEVYDHPAMIAFCVVVAITGSGIKMYCAYLSGLNNYYYYDMMLDTPNARFVDSGLYKWFSSPTYHIGYIDGYGFAMLSGWLRRGDPILGVVFTFICHVTISIVNELVEQPSVRSMYSTPEPSLQSSTSQNVT